MRVRPNAALGTLALLALAATPAAAEHPRTITAHGQTMVGVGYTGVSCDFRATNDPTKVYWQDPNDFHGTFFASLTVIDPTAESATITCWVQLNVASFVGGEARSVTQDGPQVHLVDTYRAEEVEDGDDVYVCTRVSWRTPTQPFEDEWDGDAVTPGKQCALATTVEI